jgi:hypothetical protein
LRSLEYTVALTSTERSRLRRERLRAESRAEWVKLHPWLADLTPLEALLDDRQPAKRKSKPQQGKQAESIP